MDAKLTVEFDDGRVEEIIAKVRDQLAWEKAAPGRSWGRFLTQMVNGETQLQDLYSLAFATMKRSGAYTGSQKDFEASAVVSGGHRSDSTEEDESEVDEADASDPTRPDRSSDG
jgi:hypothetical protein